MTYVNNNAVVFKKNKSDEELLNKIYEIKNWNLIQNKNWIEKKNELINDFYTILKKEFHKYESGSLTLDSLKAFYTIFEYLLNDRKVGYLKTDKENLYLILETIEFITYRNIKNKDEVVDKIIKRNKIFESINTIITIFEDTTDFEFDLHFDTEMKFKITLEFDGNIHDEKSYFNDLNKWVSENS